MIKFPLGQTVTTPAAQAVVTPEEMLNALNRHQSGDWGDLSPEDREENEAALKHGNRLLSAYKTAKGKKFWIITEWDRSITTVLLPSDY